MTPLAIDWRYAPLAPKPGSVRVRQYRPNYFSGFETAVAYVATAEDVRALEWVKQWADDGFTITCDPYCHDYPRAKGEAWLPEWIIQARRPDTHWVIAFADGAIDGLPTETTVPCPGCGK